MAANTPTRIWTTKQFAELVKQLRTCQKANGTGYKTPAATTSARSLENEVDAAIAQIEKFFPF